MSKTKTRKKDVVTVASIFIRKPLTTAIIGALTSTLLVGQVYAADDTKDKSSTTEQNTSADSAAADAPQTPAQDENRLSSVVVTAQKRAENAQDVPGSLTALDGATILDTGIGRSAQNILNFVPNASAYAGQHGRPRWWIRGVGTGQQQIDFPNPVGFYQDEVYIANSSATGYPLYDIDQVLVLSGPQGTLWGKNTTGGAVSVVSKKPSFSDDSKLDNYFKVDYGSHSDKILEGAYGGTIIDERIAGRLSVFSENADGYFTNANLGTKDGSLTDENIRGQLLFEFSPDLEGLLNVHYRDYKTNGSISSVTGTGPNGAYTPLYTPSLNPQVVSTNAPDNSQTTQNGASFNLKWQLGKYTVTSISGYENWQNTALSDSDNTPLEIGRGWTDAYTQQFSEELRIASPREDRWNWIAGLYLYKDDVDYQAATATLNPNGAATSAAYPVAAAYSYTTFKQTTNSAAIFASNTYNFTDSLLATLGVRLTTEEKQLELTRLNSLKNGTITWANYGSWWNSYTGQYASTGAAGTFTSNPDKTWNAITYDFTPEYKIDETQRVYYKFAHGVKSGGFNTAATSTTALNTLNPEVLNNNEIGYKSEWLDGRLNFNADIFHYQYKNDQVNVVGLLPNTTTAVSYLQNVSSAHANGAEFTVEALPTSNLHINANVGLLATNFDNFTVLNNGGNYDGNQFVRSPHLTSLLAADYKIPLENGNKIVLGTDIHFTSNQKYYVTAQTNPLLGQEAYTISNARITYETGRDRLEYTAYVNNLGDTFYHAHALPGGTTAYANGATTIWSPPRTIGVSATLRF
jgi:iron complex outermembrane receptor protein